MDSPTPIGLLLTVSAWLPISAWVIAQSLLGLHLDWACLLDGPLEEAMGALAF